MGNWVDIIKPLMVGVVLVGLFVIVPIIAILTEHQRKMAKILHGRADDKAREEIRALRAELHRALPDQISAPKESFGLDDGEIDAKAMVIGLQLGHGKRDRHAEN